MSRRRMIAPAAALAVMALASDAPAQAPPSFVGQIRLKDKDGKCGSEMVSDKVEVDLSMTGTAYWLVVNRCSTAQKVTVGVLKKTVASGAYGYFKVLDCGAERVRAGEVKLVACEIDRRCGAADGEAVYQYSVCSKGAIVADPELRLKGRGPGLVGECPSHKDKAEAEADCRGQSQ